MGAGTSLIGKTSGDNRFNKGKVLAKYYPKDEEVKQNGAKLLGAGGSAANIDHDMIPPTIMSDDENKPKKAG